MAHIDITLYAGGKLRLTRHGRGRGGNVLIFTPTNEQVSITDEGAEIVDTVGAHIEPGAPADRIREYFKYVGARHRTTLAPL